MLMKSEQVRRGIEEVMGEGNEGEEWRKRARELGKMAKRAMEEGGSSFLNMTVLIQGIMQQVKGNQPIT